MRFVRKTLLTLFSGGEPEEEEQGGGGWAPGTVFPTARQSRSRGRVRVRGRIIALTPVPVSPVAPVPQETLPIEHHYRSRGVLDAAVSDVWAVERGVKSVRGLVRLVRRSRVKVGRRRVVRGRIPDQNARDEAFLLGVDHV